MDGLIYKIVCNKTGKKYIGSTTQSLAKRKALHKMNCNSSSSKEIIDTGDWSIEVIEKITFDNKKDLLNRERHYIEIAFKKSEQKEVGFCVNKNRPIITNEERKEQSKKNMHKWYLANRENHIKRATEYNIANYEKHKESMRRYYRRRKENAYNLKEENVGITPVKVVE
jgi:hypothetical protein